MQHLNPLQAAPMDTASSKIQLFISCRKLKDMDLASVSDPVCTIYMRESETAQWSKVDQTECIKDNLNPDFEKSFILSYYFERHQYIRFEVCDGMNSGKELDLIGTADTSIGNIVGSKNQTFVADLKKTNHTSFRGNIIVRADSVQESNWDVNLRIQGRGLPTMANCLCGQDNIFFEIYRGSLQDPKLFLKVYDSDPVSGTVNPIFPAFKLKGQQLCNSQKDLPIQIKFFNRQNMQNNLISSVTLTLNEMLDRKEFDLKNIHLNQVSGAVIINQIQLVEKPSFIEYLRSGWQISLTVAIDFTASNGEFSQPNSLHFLGAFNQYEQAIGAVGSILEPYDYDKSFPVYGFGGVPRFIGQNSVNHCFPLNGDPTNPEVLGTFGILDLYRRNLPGISLSGPTYFSHVISQMQNIIKSRGPMAFYNILLIITDGEIHDMQSTKDLIVQGSSMPLSIIIIGVGEEKFALMKQLDSDRELLRDSMGRPAQRDIVQFVKYKKYAAQGIPKLAEKVLQEVPDQLVNFMVNNGIKPAPVQFAQY
eukprot:403371854